MKKFMKEFAVAGVIIALGATAAVAANSGSMINESGICTIVREMEKVFRMLRTLAFVGAAFSIAGWAWGYLTKGEAKMDDLKNKGSGLMVGFILLFGMGFIFQFLGSTAGHNALGCGSTFSNWGSAVVS